jgi:UDPglucose 6-dehydrogenase
MGQRRGVNMTILVVGLGFVGLTCVVGFASKGINVIGYDISSSLIDELKLGEISFFEPNLKELLHSNSDNIYFTDNLEEINLKIDLIFVCVGTPYNSDGSADLRQLFSAIDSINLISDSLLYGVEVVIKSTVPPGTTDSVFNYIRSQKEHLPNFNLYNNPEFLREGFAVQDFLSPDRIVIGAHKENYLSQPKIRDLYNFFNSEVFITNWKTAEFIKYLSNTFLSTLISYSNEMSIIADIIGDISIKTAFEVLHKDFRINESPIKSYVYPGFGYGGYCLPKDTMALRALSVSKGFVPKIISSNIDINNEIMDHVLNKIEASVLNSSAVGILGLSFKAGSDDVRESKTLTLIQKLLIAGYTNITCHDPLAIENFKSKYKDLDVNYNQDLDDLIERNDVLIIATPWTEYINLMKTNRLSNKFIIDLKFAVHDFISKPQ